jgi:hypothetical protein
MNGSNDNPKRKTQRPLLLALANWRRARAARIAATAGNSTTTGDWVAITAFPIAALIASVGLLIGASE